MCRLNDSELVIWSKKAGSTSGLVHGNQVNPLNCKDVELSTRNDLSVLVQHEDKHFVLLYADQDLFMQAQLINPTTENLSELSTHDQEILFMNMYRFALY